MLIIEDKVFYLRYLLQRIFRGKNYYKDSIEIKSGD